MSTIPWQSMDEREIRRRLYGAVPSGSLALHALLSCIEVGVDRGVPTAAVVGRLRPRLLVNPDFLAKHCRTEAHLYMLVMHELMHVTLGHTRLFPLTDKVANIAFDAVINAFLCHRNPEPEYTSFFTELYSRTLFPDCLLRPPRGFPRHVGLVPEIDLRIASCLHHLYLPESTVTISYQELFWLLARSLHGAKPIPPPPLLGNHGVPWADEVPPPLRQRIASTVERSRAGSHRRLTRTAPAAGPGEGSTLQRRRVQLVGDPALALRISRRLASLRGRAARDAAEAQADRGVPPSLGQSVLPDWRDRSAAVHAALLGSPKLLWRTEVEDPRRTSREAPVRLYLDVSDSMGGRLPALLWAVCHAIRGQGIQASVQLYCFSTEVVATSLQELDAGWFATTFGTRIRCVTRHWLASSASRRAAGALVLTDGELDAALEAPGCETMIV